MLVPFAGVGPCAIAPARRRARVTAVEKNQDFCRFLRENIVLNNVEPRVLVYEGDLEAIIPTRVPGFDRVIIPAPYGFDRALFLLLPLVRTGGMLHFYTFKHAMHIPTLHREYPRKGLKIHCNRRCGYAAPGIARYAFDMEKQGGCSEYRNGRVKCVVAQVSFSWRSSTSIYSIIV